MHPVAGVLWMQGQLCTVLWRSLCVPGREEQQPDGAQGCAWMPEYGSWMVEGTPKVPYGGLTSHLVQVEENMRLRRKRLLEVLAEDEIAPTVR